MLVSMEKEAARVLVGDCPEDSDIEEDDKEGWSEDDERDEDREETEMENEYDREGSAEGDNCRDETDNVDENEEKRREDKIKKKRRIWVRKISNFFCIIIFRYAKENGGLMNTLKAVYSGKKIVVEDKSDNDLETHKTSEALTRRNDDFQGSSLGMKDELFDSSYRENGSE